MGQSEYMMIHIRLIPPEIIAHYNLNGLLYQYGCIYIEIIRGMYGLPQVGILANNLLAQLLKIMDIIKSNKHQDCGDMCRDLFHSHW